jgi:small ligand-binding sensory domain FIST
MHWSSTVVEHTDLDQAVEAATTTILADLDGKSVDLAVVFLSSHFAPRYGEFPELLRDFLPHQHLLGCSAGGVIGGGREIEQRPALSLTVAHLPGVIITPICLTAPDLPDADASPRTWIDFLDIPPDPISHFVILADPFSFPISQFLAGMDYAYPQSVKVGGLASGARGRQQNVLYSDKVSSRSGLAGVALQGNISVATIVAQGCRPVGRPVRITRGRHGIIFELEGKPALSVIKELITDMSSRERDLASEALFVGVEMSRLANPSSPSEYLIRNIIGVDPQSGALRIGEQVQEGQVVHFHVRDAETSAEDLALHLDRYSRSQQKPVASGALLFSCLGRGRHLYGHADHDSQSFREYLGTVPLGGFFCNGEIGPVADVTHVHGYTSSFGIFSPAQT